MTRLYRRVRPRVVFLGRSETMNEEARQGVAAGRLWAAEMAEEREKEVLLSTIEFLPNASVLEVDMLTFCIVWRLVLGPAVDKFHARHGDDESREKYRMSWEVRRYDFLRGFYQGALAILVRRTTAHKDAACADNQREEPAAGVPSGNKEEKGMGS